MITIVCCVSTEGHLIYLVPVVVLLELRSIMIRNKIVYTLYVWIIAINILRFPI